MWVLSQGQKDPLEKKMATHSSILAWKIPWTEEEPGGLHHSVTKSRTQLSDFTFTFTYSLRGTVMFIVSSDPPRSPRKWVG